MFRGTACRLIPVRVGRNGAIGRVGKILPISVRLAPADVRVRAGAERMQHIVDTGPT